jgi:ankyrin repeat protein
VSNFVRTNNKAGLISALQSHPEHVNSRHPLGWTPLHVAAINGNVEMVNVHVHVEGHRIHTISKVQFLLESGADPNTADQFSCHTTSGRQAYEMAFRRQRVMSPLSPSEAKTNKMLNY